jgi:iron complex outermembrane receptor protein
MRTIRKAALIAVVTLFCHGARAGDAAPIRLALVIEPQSLRTALASLAEQTGLQIMRREEDAPADGLTAPRVVGELSAQEALDKLLEKTGLRYEFLNDRTVRISRADSSSPGERALTPGGGEGRHEGSASAPLAQAQNRPREREEAVTQGTRRALSRDPSAGREDSDLEEIVVTGTQIRGVENRTAPLTVLERSYIDSTGLSTTAELIQSLPQNFALASQSAVALTGVSDPGAQGASINLRGIGEGTTLVLLNGRRLALGFTGSAADISALPLSAVQRVEVITDGASAIYGSDAVGGVVNFILRSNFEGAETQLEAGHAVGNVDQYRASQLFGHKWSSGNATLALDYFKRDLLRADERSFVPDAALIGSLLPQDKTYSGMISGRQSLTDRLSLFADSLYTKRDSYNEAAPTIFERNNTTRNPQFTGTLGLDAKIVADWQIETSGSYARNDLDVVTRSNGGDNVFRSLFEVTSGAFKADGSVWKLPGGSARVAVGADWRSESLEYSSAGLGAIKGNADQIVRSAFAELNVPLVGTANSVRGVRRAELSVAARYDDYSNFGSSVNPKAGLMWEPLAGLRFRGSYGTSYAAPRLADYNPSSNFALALMFPDPESPTGFSRQLILGGVNLDGLTAQESKNLSIGIDFAPPALERLQVGINYYTIKYRDQIANPPSFAVVVTDPAIYRNLLVRSPSAAQVQAAIAAGQLGQGLFDCNLSPLCGPNPNFDPASVDLLVDTRRRNMSIVRTQGMDFSIQYGFAPSWGDVQVGLNSTYIFDLRHQITPASPRFDSVSTFNNPPHLRLRGMFGWRNQAWSMNTFLNHTGYYSDNRTTSDIRIASYTTLDMRLAYQSPEKATSDVLSGVTVSLNVQNLLDRDPPRTAIISAISDMGFDPTNASPLKRLISVELGKRW